MLAAALAAGALPYPRSAAAVETILQDDAQLLHRPYEEVRASLRTVRDLGIRWVRLTAGWSVIAPEPDSSGRPRFDAADPNAYPPGAWDHLDRAVAAARELRLEPLIDVAFWAPRWATEAPADQVGRLRTEIDAHEYALFARAVARRYDGSFVPDPSPSDPPAPPSSPDRSLLDSLLGGGREHPPAQPGAEHPATPSPLPPVTHYTIWNEPNHPGFVLPQWSREDGVWIPRSADIYRRLVHAAYPAIKDVAPGTTVLIGGTASFGSNRPPGGGVRPLAFLRRLACVDERLEPVSTPGCTGFTTVPGDGFAHHPYSLRTPPDLPPRHRDNLPVASTRRLARTLRTLVARGRLGRGNDALYMTEYGYETRPHSPFARYGVQAQARFLPWAEYVATRDPAVRMWPQFLLRDLPLTPGADARTLHHLGSWQSGLLGSDGTPKPAASAFRAPAVAVCRARRPRRDRAGRRIVLVWSRLRGQDAAARVSVETLGRGSTWQRAPTAAAPAGRTSAAAALEILPGRELLRYARYRRGRSLRVRWTERDRSFVSVSLRPVGCGAATARRRRAAPAD